MKTILLILLLLATTTTYTQNDSLLRREKNISNTYLGLGLLMTASGVVMSRQDPYGHRVGIPCFMIGITIYSFGKEKRKEIKNRY